MKNFKKSLRYSLYLVLIIVISIGCATTKQIEAKQPEKRCYTKEEIAQTYVEGFLDGAEVASEVMIFDSTYNLRGELLKRGVEYLLDNNYY